MVYDLSINENRGIIIIIDVLPQENYLYYGDSLHAPYGVKSEAQIQTLSLAALFALVAGGAMVFFWKLVLKPLGGMFGIYELLPAFIFSVLVIVIVSLCTAEPDAQITEEFDKVKSGKGLQ